jgi:hypothetical protein
MSLYLKNPSQTEIEIEKKNARALKIQLQSDL